MSRTLAVLRPEPGNAATAARATAAGYAVLRVPLFAVVPLDWWVPDVREHDALVLTSANTVRAAGAALEGLAALPVIAVGEQTAAAARAVGLSVAGTGSSDATGLAALLAQRGISRALHLGGRDRTPVEGVTRAIAVYASEPRAIAPADLAGLTGSVALVHSARAATRLRALLESAGIPRAQITIGAFSAAIAAAAGSGWRAVAVAGAPSDAALFAAIDTLGR